MDYQTLNTSQSSYTFKCDTTYYLSGNVSLTGTNTFEGGTVIKYASGVTLTLGGQINWLADSYRPVILTSKNDNSVGGNHQRIQWNTWLFSGDSLIRVFNDDFEVVWIKDFVRQYSHLSFFNCINCK